MNGETASPVELDSITVCLGFKVMKSMDMNQVLNQFPTDPLTLCLRQNSDMLDDRVSRS